MIFYVLTKKFSNFRQQVSKYFGQI